MSRAGNIIRIAMICGSLFCSTPGVCAQGGWGRGSSEAATSSRAEKSEAITKWLAKQAFPLRSVEAGQSLEDLKPLKKILRDVRLVGLGEGTHGTREFFQFKHRMVEFLVKEMNFTVLAMEVSYPAALDLNEYVLHGKGDGQKALAIQGLWAYDTNEITALIEWLRRYNETVPEERKVKFVGFDMHNNEQAMDNVLSYLKRVAPERVGEVSGVFQVFRATSLGKQHFEYISNVGDGEKSRVQVALNELLGFLYLNENRFSRLTSPTEFEQTMRHARILAQFADIYRRPPFDEKNPANSSGYTRDFYMAENIERIVAAEKPDARVIAWAHNEHIGVGMYERNMGEYLRQTYGAGYYALGTSFNEGSFQARLISPTVTIGA
ncbi:MAG TPA: erythromycin esterase family protein, partial [Pyrinomonadaceae bacterium]|nr:erythromycin esterase family protein [Pyrinomonadaceae bacterium]